jgi:hypothetical protein
MQDRYVGDVGDFGKYALLRRLCGVPTESSVRLGVIWCRFPNESYTNDGRHTSYLYSPKFENLDCQLLLHLKGIVEADRRQISSVADTPILHAGTVFCDDTLSPTESDAPFPHARLRHRHAWLQCCLSRTSECQHVFFDPDNGLEVASVPKQHPKAGKYIYWDELVPFWKRGNSLLIYHHLNRTVSAARQVQALQRRFAIELDRAMIVPLVFRRGSSRVFWLIHRGDDLGRELERRTADLLSGGWSQHFRPFGWPDNDQATTRTP